MAEQNFKVKNGLTVGNYAIIDSHGNVSVPGSLSVIGATTLYNITVPGTLQVGAVKVGSNQIIGSQGQVNASSLTATAASISSLNASTASISGAVSASSASISGNITASGSLTIGSSEIIDSSGNISTPGDATITGLLLNGSGQEYSTKLYVDAAEASALSDAIDYSTTYTDTKMSRTGISSTFPGKLKTPYVGTIRRYILDNITYTKIGAFVSAAATADTIVSILKNDVQVATITILAGETYTSFSTSTPIVCSSGDYLTMSVSGGAPLNLMVLLNF